MSRNRRRAGDAGRGAIRSDTVRPRAGTGNRFAAYLESVWLADDLHARREIFPITFA